MKVESPKAVRALHGKFGNLIFRSFPQPDGSYKIFVQYDPRKIKHPRSRQLRDNYETFTRHLREQDT